MSYMKINCLQCNQEFFKRKKEVQRGTNHFCSRSCSATYNNKKYPKRKKEGVCKDCKVPINVNYTYCSKCWMNIKSKTPKEKIGHIKRPCQECGQSCRGDHCSKCVQKLEKIRQQDDTLKDLTYTHLHKSSAYAKIRTRARTIAKREGWKSCTNCGYDKHIEVCHKKAISDYPEDTLVSEVNHLDNLVALCPNCHWEFDNGLLTL